MRSRRAVTAAAAALLAGAIAAGVSYATIPDARNVYSACMLRGVGTIRLIDRSLPDSNLMSRCKSGLETEVTWNQAGQPGPSGAQGEKGAPGAPGATGAGGADGVSVTSAEEPAGGNCAHGGAKFTAANGVTYACNGADGGNGPAAPTLCTGSFDSDVQDVTGCTLLQIAGSRVFSDDEVTTTGLTGGVAGQIVTVMLQCVPFCLDDTRTILDDGSLALAGDAVLFPRDTVQLVYTGSFWSEVGRSDN
jgi:hypothetical protein